MCVSQDISKHIWRRLIICTNKFIDKVLFMFILSLFVKGHVIILLNYNIVQQGHLNLIT